MKTTNGSSVLAVYLPLITLKGTTLLPCPRDGDLQGNLSYLVFAEEVEQPEAEPILLVRGGLGPPQRKVIRLT